jgi:hypothetical protein
VSLPPDELSEEDVLTLARATTFPYYDRLDSQERTRIDRAIRNLVAAMRRLGWRVTPPLRSVPSPRVAPVLPIRTDPRTKRTR